MAYEFFYSGGYSSLEPESSSLVQGYTNIPAGEIGATTSIQTANQLREVTNLLNQGMKAAEVSTIKEETFDMIPKQHLQEIRRLGELTGSEVSVHGAIIEPAGKLERGGWNEASRMESENAMLGIVTKSHELNPKGNIPVTFHASAEMPEGEEKIIEEGKEKIKGVWIINPRTGSAEKIKQEEKFFPEKEETKEFSPEMEIKKRNEEIWTKTMGDLNIYSLRGEEAIRDALRIVPSEIKDKVIQRYKDYSSGKEEIANVFPAEDSKNIKDIFTRLDHGHSYIQDSYRLLRELYNDVYKEASGKDKELLDSYKEKITPLVKGGIEKDPEKMIQFSEIVQEGFRVMKNITSPKTYVPLNAFLIDKSAETFGNVAFKAYKEFGSNAPIISIENPPAGGAMSRAEDLRQVIGESRKKFIEQAKKEGMSFGEAERAAEKLIGATWDTSHIAMLRRYGYSDKDLIKEAEKIAPFVKHVHYNDNFGSSHTDLPPGMGNVPMKEIMEKLNKAGFEGKKIFEGGNFFQNFQTSPHPYVLEGSNSPIYPMTSSPLWSQTPVYGNYLATPIAYMPEQHHALWGAGFSNLPAELSGQIPGRQRTTGTPMD